MEVDLEMKLIEKLRSIMDNLAYEIVQTHKRNLKIEKINMKNISLVIDSIKDMFSYMAGDEIGEKVALLLKEGIID